MRGSNTHFNLKLKLRFANSVISSFKISAAALVMQSRAAAFSIHPTTCFFSAPPPSRSAA